MSEIKVTRLSKIARELNVGINTIVDFLHKKGIKIETNPNTKVTPEQYDLLLQEYSNDLTVKRESEKLNLKHLKEKQETITLNDLREEYEGDGQEFDEVLIKDSSASSATFETETEKEIERGDKIKLHILGKISIEKKARKEQVQVEKPEAKEKTEVKVRTKPGAAKTVEREDTDKDVLSEKKAKEAAMQEDEESLFLKTEKKELEVKVLGKIDLESMNQRTRPPRKTKEQKEIERKARITAKHKETEETKTLEKPKSRKAGAIDETGLKPKGETVKTDGEHAVSVDEVPVSEKEDSVLSDFKRKRKRIKKEKERVKFDENRLEKKFEEKGDKFKKKKVKKGYKFEISEDEVDRQIKDTMSRLAPKGKSKGSKYRREKRDLASQKLQAEEEIRQQQKNIIKVTEFVSVNELANMMNVLPTEVIATCMNMGLFVSINQRLDAETMALVADEFDYKVEFVSVELQESIREEDDEDKDLQWRPPIVTVMGHVDHGKTKLLDHIRKTNVIAGEAGGITQHIGAYNVELSDNKRITFLDTPGHEAFTAMRARGAQITDVAIIVVAADDGVMPQTLEAINHAQAAGVPMVFAINKIDKPTANPDKIKEALSKMNILVEDWGGKNQSQEISAKKGLNIELLLEKVLLEAEMLDLKANPNRPAVGTVIESTLDKGRGYVATVLVESGTLRIGDIMLAGSCFGHIKAMYNERGYKVAEVGPATPALILGLNGAPQAGDKFNIMESDREAKDIATKEGNLQREQGLRTQK